MITHVLFHQQATLWPAGSQVGIIVLSSQTKSRCIDLVVRREGIEQR